MSDLMKISQRKFFKKGENILSTLRDNRFILFVYNGLIRAYVIQDGKEITIEFYIENDFFSPSLFKQYNGMELYISSVNSSIIVTVRINDFHKLREISDSFFYFENRLLEEQNHKTFQRILKFQTMNATERYNDLIENRPFILKYSPLNYVASYLGINNASLSKIRASIK